MIADILLALGLAAVFVSGMTASSIEARQIFDKARARQELITVYQAHSTDFVGLLPYQSRQILYGSASSSQATQISARTKWYGNDRIETDIVASSSDASVSFVAVNAYPFMAVNKSAATPICSPNISDLRAVGSYDWNLSTSSAQLDITPITLPIDPLLPMTDFDIRDGVAYISIDSAKASDPDLVIADIHDPKHPNILSTINTGPGIQAIALSGKYVFAAADSTAAQLHVIRLDSLNAPVLAKKYRLPLPQASTTSPVASAIFYEDGIVYLGTEKWDGEELSAIDVSSPESPMKIGGFETGSKVDSIFVRDDIAYMADADQSQMRRLDITDPRRPNLINAFSSSGWQRQEGKSLSYFEDSLAFGRTSGGFDIPADHELFNFIPASSTFETKSLNIPGGAYGAIIDRDHIYEITRTLNQEFTVFNRDLSTTSSSYYPLPVAPQAITCDEDDLYVLAQTAPVIYEISFKANK